MLKASKEQREHPEKDRKEIRRLHRLHKIMEQGRQERLQLGKEQPEVKRFYEEVKRGDQECTAPHFPGENKSTSTPKKPKSNPAMLNKLVQTNMV